MTVARVTSGPMLRAASTVERYAVYDEFASGGMATVHLARLDGAHGFRRTVAVKRLRQHISQDGQFALMLVDEARLAARIRHHNVVSTLDVVRTDDELLLVMDYVHGESLMKLARRCAVKRRAIPVEIACAIMADALHGLHAAHVAKSERGEPLEIVHRDVSPQNLLVGADGVTRIVDFGIAKAAGRAQTTRDNVIKGKLAYMAPEQIDGGRVNRGTDVFAASIVLWELLTGERLFLGENQQETVFKVLSAPLEPPSTRRAELSPVLDAVVMRGLERDLQRRYGSAEEMALALEDACAVARPARVARWVESVAGGMLEERAKLLSAVERADAIEVTPPTAAPPTAAPPTPGKRSYLKAWLAAAAALVLALVAGLATRAAPVTPARAETKPSVPALPTPEPLTEPSVQPVVDPIVEPIVKPRLVQQASKPGRRRRAKVETPAAQPTSCDPPFTLDRAGRTLFKVECM